jgi:hypothetical protein
MESFTGNEIVITEKMDGENTTLYRNKIHARSLDSVNHPSRNWVKNFWGQIQYKIPDGIRICGENCYAKHSIHYTDLDSYFLGFNAWKDNTCLSWDDTMDIFNKVGITPVPLIYRGIYDEDYVKDLSEDMSFNKTEGYVIRISDSFDMENFTKCLAKFVRKDHVQTDEHWMKQTVTPNLLGIIGT